jgi:hypothetical protein
MNLDVTRRGDKSRFSSGSGAVIRAQGHLEGQLEGHLEGQVQTRPRSVLMIHDLVAHGQQPV